MEDPGKSGGSDLLEIDDRLCLPASAEPLIAVGWRPHLHVILPFEHLESCAGNEERLRPLAGQDVNIIFAVTTGVGEDVDLVTAGAPLDAAHTPMMKPAGRRPNARRGTIPTTEARFMSPI